MKILVGYPPLNSKKGVPLLSQNRQFQYFNNPAYIFPIIPASAATLLKSKGFEVIWKDAIVENLIDEEFEKYLTKQRPDLFLFETKTPVIKQHWKIINKYKEKFPKMLIAICGDHVTAFPEETMKNSKADFVLTGGDYDYSILELSEALLTNKKLPHGLYFRDKQGKIQNTGQFQLTCNLNELPFIDRELTHVEKYAVEYNIKVRPFAYTMVARDCPYGKCKFCSWTTLFPKFRTRSPESLLDEIGMLIEKYKVKEVFDDSGTLPGGAWLEKLCQGLINRGYNKKIAFSCNMRFDYLTLKNAMLMKKANFRLLKFGLESGNQKTLDRINKNIKLRQIIQGCRIAKSAGLTVHLTMMVGYPWENKQDAKKTLNLTKYLMQNGLADVLQSTIVIPYPGTPLYREAMENNWFLFDPNDYERFDMTEPVMKTENMSPEEVQNMCNQIYKIFLTPKYMLTHLKKIKNKEDIMYTLRGIKAVLGHLRDFSRK